MLQSIRNIVDIDNMKYEMEKYSNKAQIITAIKDQGKCPVIITQNTKADISGHAMVAFEISKSKNGKQCIKCKNSYGQNPSAPGKV